MSTMIGVQDFALKMNGFNLGCKTLLYFVLLSKELTTQKLICHLQLLSYDPWVSFIVQLHSSHSSDTTENNEKGILGKLSQWNYHWTMDI